MSLLDDYMESSEAAHGTSTVQYGADTYTPTNGFDGLDNVRVRKYTAIFILYENSSFESYLVRNGLRFHWFWPD